MAGTSIIFQDASLAQANVLATLWTPEGIAPLLVDEFVFGGSADASIANRAALGRVGTMIGQTVVNPHSLSSDRAGMGDGFNTNSAATEIDQTFVIVARGTASGGVFASAGFTGFLAGVNGDPWSFYNAGGGVAPHVATTPFLGAGYQFVVGWGSQGDVGRICTGQNGALNATGVGIANGGARSPTPIKIGADVYGNAVFDVAYAARVPAILTQAQRLAWYHTLRGDGSAGSSPLGVPVY